MAKPLRQKGTSLKKQCVKNVYVCISVAMQERRHNVNIEKQFCLINESDPMVDPFYLQLVFYNNWRSQ